MADISVFFGVLVAVAIGFYVGKLVTRREYKNDEVAQKAEKLAGGPKGPSKK